MIPEFLLTITIMLTILGYLTVFITYLINKKKKVAEKAYETVIRLTKKDNSIHLVEESNALLNKYVIKRNIIKLTSNTYNSDSLSSTSVAYLFAGYSLIDNKTLKKLGKFIPYLLVLTLTPVIGSLISLIVSTKADAKIGLIFLGAIAFYQYFLYGLNVAAVTLTKPKEEAKLLNIFLKVSNLFFIITLLQIVRLGIIILQI